MPSLLLVEDEPMVAKALKRSLQREGHDVDVAHGHAEVTMYTGPYDVGVFDVRLPDGNGIELAEQLHHRGVVKGVIFFSGMIDENLERRARKSGVFVHKNESIEALRDAITLVLTRE